MTFDSTFTNNNDTSTSLRKKMVVGGAIALLLGVATYSSNGASNVGDRRRDKDRMITRPPIGGFRGGGKNLLRSTQGTATDTDVVAVAAGGDTTSSLLRTSEVSTSTSKVMAQEDEDSFNIVSNMDGSSKSTQKPIKKMGEVEYFE